MTNQSRIEIDNRIFFLRQNIAIRQEFLNHHDRDCAWYASANVALTDSQEELRFLMNLLTTLDTESSPSANAKNQEELLNDFVVALLRIFEDRGWRMVASGGGDFYDEFVFEIGGGIEFEFMAEYEEGDKFSLRGELRANGEILGNFYGLTVDNPDSALTIIDAIILRPEEDDSALILDFELFDDELFDDFESYGFDNEM